MDSAVGLVQWGQLGDDIKCQKPNMHGSLLDLCLVFDRS
jgi:hypothetical protein